MNDIEKQIEKYKEQAEHLSELRDDVFNVKADITVTAVGILLEKLDDSANNFLAASLKKEYYDKDLAATLKTTISEAIKAFSKLPEINVNPNINVDLKPLQSIAENISHQNKTLVDLINKMIKGNNSDELQRLIMVLVNKNNEFLEKAIQVDYSAQFKEIVNAINNKPVATEWKATVTKRLGGGALEELVIKTVK